MIRYRKVGGLRFLRIGRLQFSFCVCRTQGRQMTKLQRIRDHEAACRALASKMHVVDGHVRWRVPLTTPPFSPNM